MPILICAYGFILLISYHITLCFGNKCNLQTIGSGFLLVKDSIVCDLPSDHKATSMNIFTVVNTKRHGTV